ncbi:MAG: Rha family transcriptional regulator [Methylomonas sp.]
MANNKKAAGYGNTQAAQIETHAHSTNNSLALIIHGASNQITVDSRDIAKQFGRDHKNVLQTLDGLLADGTISRLESKPSKYSKRGKQYRCYELNDTGFLKAMPFIGGKKSHEGQKRLVDEFMRLRRWLDRQAKERERLAFHVARLSGKDARAMLTDAIQAFVAYAKAQGSRNAGHYFSNITNAVYRAMLIIEPQATEVRELLTAIQLSTLSTLELTAAQVMIDGMEGKQPYKDIYQAVKTALDGVLTERGKLLR